MNGMTLGWQRSEIASIILPFWKKHKKWWRMFDSESRNRSKSKRHPNQHWQRNQLKKGRHLTQNYQWQHPQKLIPREPPNREQRCQRLWRTIQQSFQLQQGTNKVAMATNHHIVEGTSNELSNGCNIGKQAGNTVHDQAKMVTTEHLDIEIVTNVK